MEKRFGRAETASIVRAAEDAARDWDARRDRFVFNYGSEPADEAHEAWSRRLVIWMAEHGTDRSAWIQAAIEAATMAVRDERIRSRKPVDGVGLPGAARRRLERLLGRKL